MRHWARWVPLALCAELWSAPARAQPPEGSQKASAPQHGPLTVRERKQLESGASVSRPLRFAHDGGSYVGGLSYLVVEARPETVLAALWDVANWPEVLPRTISARTVSDSEGLSRVELVQGTSFLEARYSILLERAPDGETLRFWLDPARPHDIRDVWGFFRVRALPGGRSLITVAAALDLGPGLARLLFEDKIAGMILRTPVKIRSFVERRASALAAERPEP
jgi:hypothetical protein